MDREVSKEFMKILQKQGMKFHLETKVEKIKKKIIQQLYQHQIEKEKKLILNVMLY